MCRRVEVFAGEGARAAAKEESPDETSGEP